MRASLRAAGSALVVFVAMIPLVFAAPAFLRSSARLPPDAVSHAVTAARIAHDGLPHGWIDAYDGGFPFGPHYQSVPILMVAALVKLGIAPATATHALALLALMAAPVLFALLATRGGVDWLAATLGALVLAWIAPSQAFVGGWDAWLLPGLFSQVVALPIIVLAGSAVVFDVPRRGAPWLAALAIASHTQITVCAFVLAAPVALLGFDREQRARFVRAGIAAVALALALYLPGALSFTVPFSWAKVPSWKIVGYGAERLGWWLQGSLMDAGRFPIVTALALGAAGALALSARRRGARAALALLVLSFLLSVAGKPLADSGALGARIVEFVSPVRMMVLIPFAVAAAVTSASHLGGVNPRGRMAILALALGLVLFALPERTRWMAARGALDEPTSDAARKECGAYLPAGFRADEVRSWVSGLERSGRLTVDLRTSSPNCAAMLGVDVASAAPLGLVVGGPGGQVGVLQLAFEKLDVTRDASALRAEALGVRYVLAGLADDADAPTGFRVKQRHERNVLLEREDRTGFVGFGCVVEEWSGRDRELRDALFTELEQSSSLLDRPHALVALQTRAAPLSRAPVAADGCSFADSHASAVEHAREPGAYAADVTTETPIDVVIRATAFDRWQIHVDGAAAPMRMVAPGFWSVRVARGTHRIDAVVSSPRGYGAGILLALVVTFLSGRRRFGT